MQTAIKPQMLWTALPLYWSQHWFTLQGLWYLVLIGSPRCLVVLGPIWTLTCLSESEPCNDMSLTHFLYSALMWHGCVVQLLYRSSLAFHTRFQTFHIDHYCDTVDSRTLERETGRWEESEGWDGTNRCMSVESDALVFFLLLTCSLVCFCIFNNF